MAREQSGTKERERTGLREPDQFNVIIHNDDFTTMDFVIMILKDIFFKPEEEAFALMLKVHHSDKAVAGTYTYDIATSKANKARRLAKENGFPLRFTVEKADQ